MKFNLINFILSSIGAILYAFLSGQLNSAHAVVTNLGSVLIIGFVSGLVFIILCAIANRKSFGVSMGMSAGTTILAFGIFYLLYNIIDFVHPLQYLQGHDYYSTLWTFVFILYYLSNATFIVIMLPFFVQERKRQDRINDIINGKKIDRSSL